MTMMRTGNAPHSPTKRRKIRVGVILRDHPRANDLQVGAAVDFPRAGEHSGAQETTSALAGPRSVGASPPIPSAAELRRSPERRAGLEPALRDAPFQRLRDGPRRTLPQAVHPHAPLFRM